MVKIIENPTPEEELLFYPKGDHPWTVLTSRPSQPLANPLSPTARELEILRDADVDTNDPEALRLALEMLQAFD